MDIPVVKQGKYITVDTTIKSTDVMYIDEMSGDLGDANRKVYLAIKERPESNDPKDPLIPMNLNGRDVRFQGHDADGMYKRISLATKIVNAKAGLVEMTLPRQLYMAVGSYKNAEFEVYEVNGDTNVSTVPVGLEVYDNLVHMSVGENKVYIDEVEKLISDFEKMANLSLNGMRTSLQSIDKTQAAQKQQMNAIQGLIDTWTKLINNNGVPTTGGNVKWEGNHEFTKFVSGFTTGTVIQYFNGSNPQQDLDDVKLLTDMRSGTVQSTYYGGNKVKNNPFDVDFFVVTRHKITGSTVYEQAMFVGQDTGVIKARTVQGVVGSVRIGTWGTVSEWGMKWQSLVPYLSDEFIAHSPSPEYRIVGDKVEFRGVVTAKKTITNTNNVSVKITKDLPFNFIGGQEVIKVSGGPGMYALFAYGKKLEMQKHQIGGSWADIIAGTYMGISSTFDIQ